MMCWIKRVPSYSNAADALSREITLAYEGISRSRIALLGAWKQCKLEVSIPGEGARRNCDAGSHESKTKCELSCLHVHDCFGIHLASRNKMQLKLA